MGNLRTAGIAVKEVAGNGNNVPPHPEKSVLSIQDAYAKLFKDALTSIRAAVVLVTPAMAKNWLDKSTPNRPLARRTVERYTHYMNKGLWRVNGETIITAPGDVLLDGQHRCHAVVECGLDVPMLVISGVNPDEFKTLNQGRVRSAADTLATMKQQYSHTLASALGWLFRYETEAMPKKHVVKLSNQEVADLAGEFPGMKDSILWTAPRCKKNMHPRSLFCFLHFVCKAKQPDKADDFFHSLLENVGTVVDGSPFHKLMKKITDMAGRKKGHQELVEMASWVIKVFNATTHDRPLRSFKLNPEEPFPEVE